MAAWKRRGGLSPFHERLVGRMVEKGYELEYAERIFKQIQGFGEYGFPESHAAGFALLAYVSSWIKRHHPDAFLCGLLNAPADGLLRAGAAGARCARARRRGARGRRRGERLGERARRRSERAPSAAVRSSRSARSARRAAAPVRLGLNRISGLAEDAALAHRRRARRGAASPASKTWRGAPASTPRRWPALAEADALQALTGHRHQAAWAVAGIDTRPTEMLRATRVARGRRSRSRAPSEAETTLADYRALGLTLKRHPLSLLRAQLAAFRIEPAARLRTYPHGRLARASGLVTHRQRPETAKGTVFVTLEDETGAVNVIVWPRVAEAAAEAAARRDAAHRLRPVAAPGRGRRRGDAPARRADDRPLAAAAGPGQPQPRLPLSAARHAPLRRASGALPPAKSALMSAAARSPPELRRLDRRPGGGRPSARGRRRGDEGERLGRSDRARRARDDDARARSAGRRPTRRRPRRRCPARRRSAAGTPRVRAGDREVAVRRWR